MEGNNNSMVDNINQDIRDLRKQIDLYNNDIRNATNKKDAQLVKKLEDKLDELEAKKKAKEDDLKEVLKSKCVYFVDKENILT